MRVAGAARAGARPPRSVVPLCSAALLLLLACTAHAVPLAGGLEGPTPLAGSAAPGCSCPWVGDLSPLPLRRTNITACAIFRNEARDLFEWVSYHWLLGIDHFLLYDNESTDAPERVLAPFVERGIVTLKQRPGKKGDHPTPQLRALADCKRTARNRGFRWLTAFDIDEFLVLRAKGTCVDPRHEASWSSELHAALVALEDARVGGVVAERYDFGASGLQSREEHQMQTMAFRRRSSMPSMHGKPLVRVTRKNSIVGFHEVKVSSNWSVKEACLDGRVCPFSFFHYKTRSLAECRAKATDARLPAYNWRRRMGAAVCERPHDVQVLDTTLADNNVVACVAQNAQRQFGTAR